jgi:DNA-binding response OmpR family regulator
MWYVSHQERDKDKQLMASILIIDDDAQFRSMLRQRLERAGYEVLEAPDGRVGMRFSERNEPTW